MPKGRIGLSLSEDVLEILNKRCRGEALRNVSVAELQSWLDDKRPTRTRFIEDAIRAYALANGGPVERTAIPTALSTEPDPEAEQQAKDDRKARKEARANRKTDMQETVSKALGVAFRGSFPKPGREKK